MRIKKVLYRAWVKAMSGRDTRAVSCDGVLDLKVTMSRELGGRNGRGTNPEQLFAASHAAMATSLCAWRLRQPFPARVDMRADHANRVSLEKAAGRS